MTDTINVDNLINNILKTEDLLPGDKISKDSLMEISKKYEISPYVLAINIFRVTQNAYRGLISKGSNAKNIIILKDRIPQMIEEALKVRQIILQKENLNPGSKVNYSRLVEIAKKYGIREKIIAVYVFEIPEYSFRRLKNNPNSNACILTKKENKKSKENESIQTIREHILVSEQLKPLDTIDYNTICSLSKKYSITETVLALEVLELAVSSYYHMRIDPKRKSIILKNYFTQDKLQEAKKNIVEKENLNPFDQINYNLLLQIAKRNNINERILAIDILGLTEDQYYNIKYNPKAVAIILKSDYEKITAQELKRIKNEIFEKEGLKEGYRISFSEIEMLQSKYNLPSNQMLYILGITQNSYHFIKSQQHYKAIVKDTEVFLISQILSETMVKNQYYSKQEIEQICQTNGISLQNFFDYILGKARYFSFDQYKELLDTKGKIWVGDMHSVSKKFAEQKIEEIQRIANVVSQNIYSHFDGKKRNLDKEDLAQDACLYILTQCGDLEKNFDGDDLSRMIYLRTRMNILRQVNIKSKVRVFSTTKYYQKSMDRNLKGNGRNLDLELADNNQDIEKQAIENLSAIQTKSSIIEYLSNLLEEGYNRDTALKKVATTLGVDTETMIEAIQEELLKRGKVKKTDKGEFILGD